MSPSQHFSSVDCMPCRVKCVCVTCQCETAADVSTVQRRRPPPRAAWTPALCSCKCLRVKCCSADRHTSPTARCCLCRLTTRSQPSTCLLYPPASPLLSPLLLLHPFYGLVSRTACVSRYQNSKTSLDLNEARDDGVLGCSGISWSICKQSAPRSRQITTHQHLITQFYWPDDLPDAQPYVSEHWRHCLPLQLWGGICTFCVNQSVRI